MRKLHLLLLIAAYVVDIGAQDYEVFLEGPVHEAFLVKEKHSSVLEPIRQQPPPDIRELVPQHSDPRNHWIKGYWAWVPERNEFVWVSGTWRRPPQGLQWIPGYWRHYPEGWVWISGFWSEENERNLEYVPLPPPDLIDEKVMAPPGDNYFWIHGNWYHDPGTTNFAWYSGRWERMDRSSVFTPAHYIFRDRGFVWVHSFWDQPLEKRGIAYASIIPSPNLTEYTPSEALDPLFILENYFPNWPDYMSLYHYHFYYHYDQWLKWGAFPPWWKWDLWWSFNWQDQWWNFWWWSHPYYPNPPWITKEIADAIDPPPNFVISMMSDAKPPLNVTPNGVVGNFTLLRALRQVTGSNRPILPPGIKLSEIHRLAFPKPQKRPFLLPTGSVNVEEETPLKPFFGPPIDQFQKDPRKMSVPERPIEVETKPKERPKRRVKKGRAVQQWQQPLPPGDTPPTAAPGQTYAPPPMATPEPYVAPGRPGIVRPPPTASPMPGQPAPGAAPPTGEATPPPLTYPIRPAHPQEYHPPYQVDQPVHIVPQHPRADRRHPYQEPPWQEEFAPFRPEGFHLDEIETSLPPPPSPGETIYHGTRPEIPYPPVSKQLQHRNFLMTHPQQQHNPPGPKVHALPGDETFY